MGNILPCFRTQNQEKNPSNQQSPSQIKPSQPLSSQDLTILKLKSTQDKLLLQKKSLLKNSSKSEKEAKQYVANGDRQRAFFALKRKKLYDEYYQQTDAQLFQIQKTVQEVETAILTADMVSVLNDSNELLKKLDQSDKLENLIYDIKERDTNQEKYNEFFRENNIQDDTVDSLFLQFEAEANNGNNSNKIIIEEPRHKILLEKSQDDDNIYHIDNNIELQKSSKLQESSKNLDDDVDLGQQLLQLA